MQNTATNVDCCAYTESVAHWNPSFHLHPSLCTLSSKYKLQSRVQYYGPIQVCTYIVQPHWQRVDQSTIRIWFDLKLSWTEIWLNTKDCSGLYSVCQWKRTTLLNSITGYLLYKLMMFVSLTDCLIDLLQQSQQRRSNHLLYHVFTRTKNKLCNQTKNKQSRQTDRKYTEVYPYSYR